MLVCVCLCVGGHVVLFQALPKQTPRSGFMCKWGTKDMLQEKLLQVWGKQGRAGKKSIEGAISSNISTSAWSYRDLWGLNYISIFRPLRKESGFHTLLQSDVAARPPQGEVSSLALSGSLCGRAGEAAPSPGLSSEEGRGCQSWERAHGVSKRASRGRRPCADWMVQIRRLDLPKPEMVPYLLPKSTFKNLQESHLHTVSLEGRRTAWKSCRMLEARDLQTCFWVLHPQICVYNSFL